MHILVTGGAGFIGSHLVEYHLAKGDKVNVVDDLSTGSIENILPFTINPAFHFDHADMLTWNGLEKAVSWADRIYHMAAVVGVFKVLEEPIRVLATNIAGCERLLRAAQNSSFHPQIIIASTSEVYGTGVHAAHQSETRGGNGKNHAYGFKEDMELTIGSSSVSRWNYSISKLADEAFGLTYARRFGMEITVVRFFNTVGPRQTGRYGMVFPRFVRQAVQGEPITVYGDGLQKRCFCDVRDTARALDLLAGNSKSAGEVVNVGNDYEISIRELAELVRARACSKSQIRYIPYKEAYGEEFEEVLFRKPSLEKFFRLTGFEHQWRLEDTLDELIEAERKSAITEEVN
jgi:UDP-glucose 4-epimerase